MKNLVSQTNWTKKVLFDLKKTYNFKFFNCVKQIEFIILPHYKGLVAV